MDSAVHRMKDQWGIPHKRALFGSDGPDSTSSSSDVVEGHYLKPPDDGYPVVTQSGLLHEVLARKHGPQVEGWKPDYNRTLRITGRRPMSAVCRVR